MGLSCIRGGRRLHRATRRTQSGARSRILVGRFRAACLFGRRAGGHGGVLYGTVGAAWTVGARVLVRFVHTLCSHFYFDISLNFLVFSVIRCLCRSLPLTHPESYPESLFDSLRLSLPLSFSLSLSLNCRSLSQQQVPRQHLQAAARDARLCRRFGAHASV